MRLSSDVFCCVRLLMMLILESLTLLLIIKMMKEERVSCSLYFLLQKRAQRLRNTSRDSIRRAK